MSSVNVNESDRLGLKDYLKNCKCGNRKRPVVRIVEREKNKYNLYYSCEDKNCGGFLGWCVPFFSENTSSLSSPMMQDNGVEEMGNVRGEIQTLREEHKRLYRKVLHTLVDSMLKVPEHQVADHQARDGKLGPLVDDSGRFYKPLPDDDRGSDEVALRKFVSSNISTNSNVNTDCSLAQSVYGNSAGILAQLMELKAWFEDQTMYHFNSCLVIMVYEKESVLKGGNAGPQVQLVDFAHAMEGKGVIDHNFSGGVCSLIKLVSEILTDPDEYPFKGCSEG
ncbi:IPK domain-containing protein [Cephalotus follicularis]|uniref:Inositol polyphosphate multikinase n=1 Tax=Cephalotus follicularis TaxID=3775 RepID=A0A1Q3APQ9_CEPFO|nr:IPK domain-containing protein [Cephalotus follicularis]